MRTGRVRSQGRGEFAWQQFQADFDYEKLADRLLAHSLNDTSAVARYLQALEKFVVHVEKFQRPFTSNSDKDDSLATYLCYLCYVKDAHPSQGACCTNGLVYLCPELSAQLQHS